jgi:hypothetical protein
MDPISFQNPVPLGKERRREQRFDLQLPARLETLSRPPDQTPLVLSLVTRDISSCGAFFPTESALDIGTRVQVDLVLTPQKPRTSEVKRALIKVTGTVLRREAIGMAVDFEKGYRLAPLN